ncbi:MAG: type II secretion system F family protein [Candidatus Omnitrophica bacterium]|jgi:tight adherence protein B|nr:type II secretion system F family protein [Candidatus Omnitrophota bacterium]MDD5253032.1 type II secretion system F family protein [Candidatus Omnitrophota bacterium]
MFILLSVLILCSVILIALSLFPFFVQTIQSWQQKKEAVIAKEMDKMFYNKSPKNIAMLYFVLPFVLGLVGYIILQSLVVAIIGGLIGLAIPNFILKMRYKNRIQKFNSQLLDAINMLSSCLKGGLSLLQGFEVLVEEMPAPMNQEIGLVVRENKMGIPLEESLVNLNKRMNIEELSLVINALLVSRETGGELTKVFSRLSVTIRDNRKLKENIKTLTLQGRLQGMIMSFLPIVFVIWVLSVNKNHFDIMLKSDMGRMLLIAAVILQIVGMVLIKMFSTIKV